MLYGQTAVNSRQKEVVDMAESRCGKHIVSELNTDRFDAEYNARYAQWATRILWMDDGTVDGAFR
jgi:hypothetical protein